MSDPTHDEPPLHQRLLAELKRRKVFRVAAVYGAVAFGVIQVADPVAEALRFPAWFLPMLVVALLIGFPMALVLAWALELGPDGVKRTPSARPGEIEEIVAQPAARRWASGLTALAGVGVLVTAAWFGGRSTVESSGAGTVPAETAPAAVAAPSIAVLPFENMSADEDQVYFAEGISEELLNLLAQLPELRVAARTSSFSFRDEGLEITQIADSLNVAHVLEGSVRKAGDRVRITAQLIRADDGFHVWSETWDRRLDDIFAIQDEIAADVVEELRVTLLDQAPTVEETHPEAYALYLRARHLSEQTNPDAATRATELYREALAIDPDYASAWAGLALNYYRMGGPLGFGYDSLAPLSREAAERGLEADPENALAHSILGRLASTDGDLTAAARHHRRALQLDPGNARILGSAAVALMNLGRVEDAVRIMEERVERDPVSVAGHSNVGLLYAGLGRFEEAAEAFRTALELNPSASGVRAALAHVVTELGRPREALEIARAEPRELWRLIALVQVHHALGDAEASDAALAELIEKYEDVAAFNIAYVLAFRGEVDRAFAWLDRAVRFEDPGLSEIFIAPQLGALQEDPRWDALLERLGKSPEDLARIDFRVELPR